MIEVDAGAWLGTGILSVMVVINFFFLKQKTAYEMRMSDCSSDVCSSDLVEMGHDILATDEKHPARPFGNRHQLGRKYPIRRRSAFYLTIFSLRRDRKSVV